MLNSVIYRRNASRTPAKTARIPAGRIGLSFLIAANCHGIAQAQPTSPACVEAQQSIKNLSNQITTLQSKHGDPQYAGSASTIYAQQMRALQTQMVAAQAYAKKVCSPDAAPPQTATLIPRFSIVSVVYAPPGLDGGKSASYVDYGSGSATGSTVSTSKSFKNAASVTATVSAGAGGTGTSFSVGAGVTSNATDKTQVDIKMSQQFDLRVAGPNGDGIDHDQDQIWIWIDPHVILSKTASALTWGLDGSVQQIIQYVTIGQLKSWIANPASVDADAVGRQLKQLGYGAPEYQKMLAADPFASGAAAIDPNQFTRLSLNFPYEPAQSGAGSTLQTHSIKNEAMTTTGQVKSIAKDLSVSMTVSVAAPFVSASVKIADEWTWTNESSKSSSADSTQSATLAIGQPSSGYQGLTNVEVYWDNIWQTYLFVLTPLSESLILSGTTRDASGRTIPNAEVALTEGGTHLRTFSDAQGHYRFYGPRLIRAVRGTVSLGTKSRPVMIAPRRAATVDLTM